MELDVVTTSALVLIRRGHNWWIRE